MKKLLASLLLLISLPLQTLAASAPYFKPATLYKGQNRQAVFSESEANFLFARGYKLEDKVLGYSVVTAYSTTLSQSMTATQTTVPVSSLSTKDGHTLTMADLGSKVFLTIEPGAAKEEIVMCTTISGTAWATCTRGLAFYGTGVTAVTANQKTHASGSRVVMSNVHYVYEQLTDIDTDQTIAGIKTFTSSPIVPTPTTATQAANKSYVDGVAIAGGANASTSTKGISFLSSDPASSTSPIALNSEEVSATTGNNKVVRANGSGKIDSGFIDQTAAYTWTNTSTFSGNINANGSVNTLATTTFSGLTKVPTSTPTVAGQVVGLDASAKLPAIDGSQLTNIPIVISKKNFLSTKNANAGNGSNTYAHGLGYTPNWVNITATAVQGWSVGHFDASGQRSVYSQVAVTPSTDQSATQAVVLLSNSAGVYLGGIVSVDSTNVTITWTTSGSPGSNVWNLLFEAGK